MLSEWIDLPVSLNVRSAEAKNITFLFENFSEEEIVSFFKDNIQQTEHAVVGYRQDDTYGDILGKCDYQDVLNVLKFYVSEEASYCTGQMINITGGQVMF